jgi:pilus assembly protein CpaC
MSPHLDKLARHTGRAPRLAARSADHGRLRRGAAHGLCAVLLLAANTPGSAQDITTQASTPGPDVRISVRPAPTQSQTIMVPANRGVLVDFSVPIREVRVANPGIADVAATAPHQILVTGKSFGTTQLVVLVDGGQQQTFTIAVDVDFERLEASIRTLVPRAQVKASALMDAIVLTGTVPDAESAERIVQIANIYSPQVINHMRVAGVYQVLLRCTVAEVNRAATRALGFNGWMAGDNFKDVFAINNVGGINPVDISAAAGYSVSTPIPFGTVNMGVSPASTLALGFPRLQMQVFIQALRENGLLQVLAEPNLVTVSGQEADFLAGGEFPIPVPQSGTSNAITVEFREFGVRLRFTPTVLSEDTIRLKVTPEVSEPDFSTAVTIGGFAVPGLTQRRVDTVVELGPGQTFAIGGLLSEKTRAVASKVPALGDIPVLGALFSSLYYQSNESELVVLVTPELVAPLNPSQVQHAPGAGHIPPNDWELFGLGQLEGQGQPGRRAVDRAPTPAPDASATALDPGRTGRTARLRGPVGPASGDEGT